MSKSARRHERLTRRDKIDNNIPPTFKPQTVEDAVQPNLPKFEAKTQNQKLALAYLREGKQVVALIGSAGVGKSLIAAYWAATLLKQKKIEQVVLIRPNVLNGRTIGLLSGNESEKLAPFFVQTMEHLRGFLGGAYLEYCKNKEIIVTRAFEYIRGQSFENTLVILEEGQGLDNDEYETLLTRVGTGCQLIITGDTRQVNKGQTSGMDSTFDMIANAVRSEYDYLDDEDLNSLEDSVGVVHFTPNDILRSGFCKALVKLYFHKK